MAIKPFCITCKQLLNVYTEYPDGEGVPSKVEYRHPGEADHDPDVTFIEATAEQEMCDFCGRGGVKSAFVLRKAMRIVAFGLPSEMNQSDDYSSPWSCCSDCENAVLTKSVRKLTSHVMRTSPTYSGMSPDARADIWTSMTQFYAGFFAAEPEGPFPYGEV